MFPIINFQGQAVKFWGCTPYQSALLRRWIFRRSLFGGIRDRFLEGNLDLGPSLCFCLGSAVQPWDLHTANQWKLSEFHASSHPWLVVGKRPHLHVGVSRKTRWSEHSCNLSFAGVGRVFPKISVMCHCPTEAEKMWEPKMNSWCNKMKKC